MWCGNGGGGGGRIVIDAAVSSMLTLVMLNVILLFGAPVKINKNTTISAQNYDVELPKQSTIAIYLTEDLHSLLLVPCPNISRWALNLRIIFIVFCNYIICRAIAVSGLCGPKICITNKITSVFGMTYTN